MGQGDDLYGSSGDLQQHLHEAIGKSIETDGNRAEEDAHENRVSLRGDINAELRCEYSAAETEQFAGVPKREPQAGTPPTHRPHHQRCRG